MTLATSESPLFTRKQTQIYCGMHIFLLMDLVSSCLEILARYHCMSWLMAPQHEHGRLSIANSLYNRKHCKGRKIENAFAILKQITSLQIQFGGTFVSDIIAACATLYNMLLKQSSADVEYLLYKLRIKGFSNNIVADTIGESIMPQLVPNYFPII